MRMNRIGLWSGLALAVVLIYATSPQSADDPRRREEAGRVKTSLEQSIKSDPNNSELWTHLGFTNHKLADVNAAQTAFEKAHQLNPKNPDALYMLGLIYEKKNMKTEALRSWNDLLNVTDEKWRRDTAEKHIHHLKSNE